ncbi:Protein phosphatase PP2A regulatory subunit B [Entomophthora muscae]|uniref:Protein phosphatase PP2A regulatory subunit B n=1 Tax=Entomophthora muscae TaxID=34485 RepID=A0ACC2RW76_9FUNG|nr:Protein phosphatase PP2A regulatory subunit B [Entomophthora muscae]
MPAVATPQPTVLASNAAAFKPATQVYGSAPLPIATVNNSSTASLYVGDLNEYVTESNLFELFSCVGPVASIRVCRDKATRRSLGYAYVNYHVPADAERAIEMLNHSPIQGKPVRVMASQRDPTLRKESNANIFIKNLDSAIDNKALNDTFSAFGKVISCKVATEDGISKGYGFVQFKNHEDAELAIQKLNGMQLNSQVVYVAFHESSKERESKSNKAHATFTNVYVKGLSPSVTSEQLSELFSKYGPVTSCLVQFASDGKSKEFGFVNFQAHDDAVAAIEALNESDFHGNKILVCRAQKKSERDLELRKKFQAIKQEKILKAQGANVYIKNLEPEITEERVSAAFSAFGTITSCKIMVDEKNKSRGFGFVSYSSPIEANKAVAEMNNAVLATKPLYVNFAQRKEDRRSQLEAQHSVPIPMSMGAPMYPNAIFYPPSPNYPPPAQPGMIYPQVNMMPPRPRWNNAQQLVPAQYAPTMAVPQSPQPRSPRQPRTNNRGNNRQNHRQHATPAPTSLPDPKPASPTRLTASSLAAASPEVQKQIIGEQLYTLIMAINEDFAGKITGMLLEMDNGELLHLIENAEALNQKVAEALSVLGVSA